jgi:CrcB protein
LKTLLLISLGSAIGGAGRYLCSLLLNKYFNTSFPISTLFVNIVGCFLIGVIFGYLVDHNIDSVYKNFLTVGILGGFTTFSTFSFESIRLLQNDNYLYFSLFITGNIILGLFATKLGLILFK